MNSVLQELLSLHVREELSLRLTLTLLSVLWQGTIIGLGAAVAGRLLRHQPAVQRYRMYLAGLVLIVVSAGTTLATVETGTATDPAGRLMPPEDVDAPSARGSDVSHDQEDSRELIPDVAREVRSVNQACVVSAGTSYNRIPQDIT